MNRRSFGILMGISLALALAAPMLAHHSISAEFDTSKPISFTGVVKGVDWGNPHIYTRVEAKDADGKLVVYKVEGGPPNALFRAGWRADSIKVGETVKVQGIRAKSPTSMNVGTATITNAANKSIYSGQNPDAPK